MRQRTTAPFSTVLDQAANMLNSIVKPFASLKLTVVLLGLCMVLIYAGTWAQVDQGIWQVQEQYFHSFFTWVSFQTLMPRPKAGQPGIPGGFPMLGGYTVGALLLVNLLSAHIVRFRFTMKDLVMVPLLGLMTWTIYLWHQTPRTAFMVATIIVGVVFVLLLAMWHGKRTGIILIHLGLIVLLAGEGITSGLARESQMTIDVGSYANYSQDIRTAEIAVVDSSNERENTHTVVPMGWLEPGKRIADAKLPFEIKVEAFYPNSKAVRAAGAPNTPALTDPDGTKWSVVESPVSGGAAGSQSDIPSVVVALSKNGQDLGRRLLTVYNEKPEVVSVDGKAYDVYLRFQRIYHPYTVKLLKFVHDRYTGTQIAKDFASHVILDDPSRNEQREVRIWMNNPLRYQGETFFQASFKPGDKTTVLQVVKNPGALLPYVAITIATYGLVLHFGIALAGFLLRRSLTNAEMVVGVIGVTVVALAAMGMYMAVGLLASFVLVAGLLLVFIAGLVGYHLWTWKAAAEAAEARRAAQRQALAGGKTAAAARGESRTREIAPEPRFFTAKFLFPAAMAAVVGLYVISHAMPRPIKSAYDLETFGRIPVSFDGRVQPLDSLARNTLKVIRGRDSAIQVKTVDGKEDETRVAAVAWFLDVIADREKAASDYKVFNIDGPDVKDLIGLKREDRWFTLNQIVSTDPQKVQDAIQKAMQVEPKERNQYQRQLAELGNKINLYLRVQGLGGLHAAAPIVPGQTDWKTLADVARGFDSTGIEHPSLAAFSAMHQAYAAGNAGEFNGAARKYLAKVSADLPADARRASFETWYNAFDPAFVAQWSYAFVFVLAALCWVGWSEPFRRAALWGLAVTLVVHTVTIGCRIYISGRPPVTNLANACVFIGWGAAVFGLVLELIFRRGIGAAVAAVLGFCSLLVYHELAARDGDTFKVLVAVLDTNIWLATHVLTITLGYSATFLAGALGMFFIIGGVLTNAISGDTRKTLAKMMYGITAFAIVFSFIGTILGGIWADQSWGRFWGWDPKENGAVLIVLANALVLHARWGGIVRERGIAILAVFGSIVTCWSMFGTNLLGVGLHSYGFMEGAVLWLLIVVGLHLAIMGVGMMPLRAWKSYRDEVGRGQAVVVKESAGV